MPQSSWFIHLDSYVELVLPGVFTIEQTLSENGSMAQPKGGVGVG
jgi:hypothetical protein